MNYAGIQINHPLQAYPLQRTSPIIRQPRIWTLAQRLAASLALLTLSPVFGFMYFAVKLSSPGPFLFAQQRRGIGGTPFTVYKVRTMRPGSERATSLGVIRSDPRVTAIGRILRLTKMDELPQLWNIATGEMSIVGPRPIPLTLDEELTEKIPGFQQRYQVQPGLTSIGQVCVKDNALGEALIKDWTLRFHGELHYIRNRSLSYDLLMIALTTLYVINSFTRK